MKFLAAVVILVAVVSRPARGAWVEISSQRKVKTAYWSRPARGAWVEMRVDCASSSKDAVAPRKGRVG